MTTNEMMRRIENAYKNCEAKDSDQEYMRQIVEYAFGKGVAALYPEFRLYDAFCRNQVYSTMPYLDVCTSEMKHGEDRTADVAMAFQMHYADFQLFLRNCKRNEYVPMDVLSDCNTAIAERSPLIAFMDNDDAFAGTVLGKEIECAVGKEYSEFIFTPVNLMQHLQEMQRNEDLHIESGYNVYGILGEAYPKHVESLEAFTLNCHAQERAWNILLFNEVSKAIADNAQESALDQACNHLSRDMDKRVSSTSNVQQDMDQFIVAVCNADTLFRRLERQCDLRNLSADEVLTHWRETYKLDAERAAMDKEPVFQKAYIDTYKKLFAGLE